MESFQIQTMPEFCDVISIDLLWQKLNTENTESKMSNVVKNSN